MKILIIDDEKIILEKLKLFITKIVSNTASVLTSDNACFALDIIHTQQPDIILTDIRMPGKTGLSIASYVHENFPDKIVILITGFSDFKYAQAAIQNHVFDYILKPIDETTLSHSIQKAIQTINDRKNQQILRRKYEDYLKDNLQNLQKQFFERLLFRNSISVSSDLTEEISMLNLNHIHSYYLLSCKCIAAERDKFLEKEYYFTHIAEHYIQEKISNAIIFSYGHSLYALCPNIEESTLTKTINSIHSELKKNHVLLSVAISNYSESLSEIPQLRCQTAEISNVLKNSGHFIMLYRDLNYSPVAGIYEKSNYFQVLLNAISSCDSDIFLDCFDKISAFLEKESSDELDNFIYSFMTLFLSFFPAQSSELFHSIAQITNEQKTLLTAASLNTKKQIFQNWMMQISNQLHHDKINKNNYLAKQLLDYIHVNYEKPLSLYSIADEFNRSMPYISRLIKQTTGKNFTDLLTELRIQKAKTLLKTTSLHVNEISQKVGYPNFRYFSRIFKQQTGMTPNDYRKISCRFQ